MNFFKGKKKAVPAKQPVPRSLEDLTKAHHDLCRRAGEVQYVISVNEAELAQLNQAIKSVNNEAGARQQLDAKAAEAAKSAEQNVEARNG